MRRILLLCLFMLSALSCVALSSIAMAQDEEGSEPFAFETDAINEALPAPDSSLRLDTPRAALESFLAAIDANDHALAVGQFAVHDEVVVARS